MTKKQLCATCAEMLDDNRAHATYPPHLVHPEHGNLGTWRVHREAICPTCLTRWRRRANGRAVIVG